MSVLRIFFILFLFPSCSSLDGIFGYVWTHCEFRSSDGHDAVYLEQYFFNKVFILQYNSTLKKWTAYTEKAQKVAEALNKNPSYVKQMIKNTNTCKSLIPVYYPLVAPVEPYVKLRSTEAASIKHPAMLICSVYNFYPKQIRVIWLRNGKEMTSDVTSTEELSNGNWFYQIHSHLEYTPISGEKISCMVEHASLTKPKLYDWDPMPESDRNKIAVGTAGLLLGLVFVVVGLIYYKKNSVGRQLVPTG
ncbi:hypothetical protein LDENG_00147130 [Lucifuga dentata]|nr:hypothetical protein LDENG_00147130 [Lucifuga dentata]